MLFSYFNAVIGAFFHYYERHIILY